MKIRNLILPAVGMIMLLSGCSGGTTPLKELAETYAEIGENLQDITNGTKAVMDAPREERKALEEKSIENAKRLMSENDLLVEKATALAEKLQGTEVRCEASPALGLTVASASIKNIRASKAGATVVIAAKTEGSLSGKPYYFVMAGKEIIYKSPATYSEGEVGMTLNITTAKGGAFAREVAKAEYVRLVTEAEYKTGTLEGDAAASQTSAGTDPRTSAEPEPAYQGADETKQVTEASSSDVKIEKGMSLMAVLKAAKNVTYEYNADSGIWAHIGNVSIIIDEDQLNQKGIDLINSIPSDMEPNLAFSPDYLKPDSKILRIEKD